MRKSNLILGKKGFTLVELIIVVAIIGIIAAIAIPSYVGYIRSAKKTEAKNNLQSLQLLLSQYYSENSRYCPNTTTTYWYTETETGANNCSNCITSFLTSFKPKGAAATNAVLYHYGMGCGNATSYAITAYPQTNRGAPTGNLTVNQDGAKNGW